MSMFSRRRFSKSGWAALIAVSCFGCGPLIAVFTVFSAMLLRPLPYPSSGELMVVVEQNDRTGRRVSIVSEDLARSGAAENGLVDIGYQQEMPPRILVGSADAAAVRTAALSPSFLSVLRTRVLIGQGFGPSDYLLRHDNIAIVSFGFWLRHLGADTRAIGRLLVLDSGAVKVVGVLPRNFAWPYQSATPDIYFPLIPPQSHRFVSDVIVRLPNQARKAEAEERLAVTNEAGAIARGRRIPDRSIKLVPLQEHLFGASRRLLIILLVVAGALSVLTFISVAHLLLARARRSEMERAVKAALGAPPTRLALESVVEVGILVSVSIMLTLVGALLVLQMIAPLVPYAEYRVADFRLDWRVFALSALLCGAGLLMSGAMPAIFVARHYVLALRQRTFAPRRRRFGGAVSIATQTAFSVTLVMGALLAAASLIRALSVDRGFSSENVFVLELRAPAECAETERETLYRQALDTLRTLPDVAEVGAIDSLPLFGSGGRLLSITGRTVEERGLVYMATSGFFRALAIPVVAGSGFSDRPDDAGTALLSHSAQSRFFRGKAVGELFEGAAGVSSVRIRGIVGDTKRSFRMAPVPAMFLPMKFGACSVVNYVVRMREGAAAPVELLRRKVAAATSGGALSVERLDAQVYQRCGRFASSSC